MGRNMKNAINIKNTPAAIIMAKAVNACLDGTNWVADCTFAGSSRTPFVTLWQIETRVQHFNKDGAYAAIVALKEQTLND